MPSCIIHSCTSMTTQKNKEEHVILHPFPKDVGKIRAWLVQTKQQFCNVELLAQNILQGNRNNKYRLCSKHFQSDCYNNFQGKKWLREEALPSIFPTMEDGKLLIEETLKKKRASRKKRVLDTELEDTELKDTELEIIQPSTSLVYSSQSQLEPSFPTKCSVATQTDAELNNSDVIMKLPIPLLKVEKDNELMQREPGKYDCTMLQEKENLCSTQHVSKQSMEKDRNHEAARILNVTLEMICLITGEDYTVVKKSLGWLSRTESEFTETPLPSLIHEQKKILELNNKITELLTGEVPIRCEDVTIYFSMEEWEYLEEHKDLYKDVKIKDRPPLSPLTSPGNRSPWLSEENKRGESSTENPLETCPSPVYCPEHPEKIQSVPLDHQESEGATKSGVEKYVLVSANDGNRMRDVNGHLLHKWVVKREDNQLPDNQLPGEIFANSERRTHFEKDSNLSVPEITQIDERPFSEGGEFFARESNLDDHHISHTGEKQFSCLECGKCFSLKRVLERHLKVHTGEKPFPCLECEKSFQLSHHLEMHKRTHTGEKPFSCSDCGKCFALKSNVVIHQRTHTGQKPYSCPECGKCFSQKSSFLVHQRIHTGEKSNSCSECGKCFNRKSNLVDHLRIHTGEKPYSCSVCGKCYMLQTSLVKHLQTHTGEKPYSCSECGKCFTRKSSLLRHLNGHTGLK